MSYWYIYFMILLFGIILPQYWSRRRRRLRQKKLRMKKGGNNLMTSQLLSECIGKNVELYGEGGISGFSGKVLAVEENLIKIEDKRTIRIINADMIAQIKIKKNLEK